MFPFLEQTIKALEENKETLAVKFKKGKRLHVIGDLLGPSFTPPTYRKGQGPTEEQGKKIAEFYRILHEFDQKYEFTPAMPERFTKIYNAYLNKLREIYNELAAPAKT